MQTLSLSSARRTIEWSDTKFSLPPMPQREWDWKKVLGLLDGLQPLISNRDLLGSDYDIGCALYGYLPSKKRDLFILIRRAKEYYRMAVRPGPGKSKLSEYLAPYRETLRLLVWACRIRWSREVVAPNQNGWSKKSYALFLAIQQNLRTEKTYFLTLKFPEDVSYKTVKTTMENFSKNTLPRRGFRGVEVISVGQKNGQLHAHLLIWNYKSRERRAVNAALESLEKVLNRFASFKLSRLETKADFLRVAAYWTQNYDFSSKLDRNVASCRLPKFAQIKRVPIAVRPGRPWVGVRGFSYYSPKTIAWRMAVSRYAKLNGYSPAGNWQWIWRERRRIREFLEPEEYRVPIISGLDGHTYQVFPLGDIGNGIEEYRLVSDERGTFIIADGDFEDLAKLDCSQNVLTKSDFIDLVSGLDNRFHFHF